MKTPMRATGLILIATALVLGGCSKKKAEPMPPPPADAGANGAGDASGFETDSTAGGGVGSVGLPGSQADFVANVSADRIFFATDSSTVDGTGQAILQSQAAWLASNPTVRVTIEGHTDERGTREYNLALGDRRANAARDALIALGVSSTRIATISYGKERPDALGSDDASWGRNRRAVTVTVQR